MVMGMKILRHVDRRYMQEVYAVHMVFPKVWPQRGTFIAVGVCPFFFFRSPSGGKIGQKSIKS